MRGAKGFAVAVAFATAAGAAPPAVGRQCNALRLPRGTAAFQQRRADARLVGRVARFRGGGARPPVAMKGDAAVVSKKSLPDWVRPCAAEAVGTALIVLGGCGAGAASFLSSTGLVGSWQAASITGWSVAVAVWTTMHISGAHLNPAVTLAMKVLRPQSISWSGAARYIAAQLAGAALAAQVVMAVWGANLAVKEKSLGVIRGMAGSERSASVLTLAFGKLGVTSALHAAALEALGTGLLTFVIFSMTHPRNTTLGEAKKGGKALLPLIIGFTVAVIACVLGPLTGAGLNPARDLGPRLVAYLSGWGRVAFPGFPSGCWAYTAGPIVGGLIGGVIANLLNG